MVVLVRSMSLMSALHLHLMQSSLDLTYVRTQLQKKQQSGRKEAARLYEEIKAEGERHLDQAAEWIVRRVVEF